MVGAILYHEMVLGGRRNRLHIIRWLFAGWLIVVLGFYFFEFLGEQSAVASLRLADLQEPVRPHVSAPQVVGSRFMASFLWQQVLLIYLVPPIFTASAIVDEKRQGTLQYLLLSEMEPRHLLVGKFFGRLAQICLVLLAAFPLVGLLAGFGGIEPISLGFMTAGLIGPLVGMTALSLLASVLCRQTRDAVLAVYILLLIAGFLVLRIGGPLRLLNPIWVLEPAWFSESSLNLPQASRRLLLSMLLWGVISISCLVVGSFRLPVIYFKELENSRKESRRWYSTEREPVTDQPILWREQHIEGLAINPTLRRIPFWVGILGVALASTFTSVLILFVALAPGSSMVDVLAALLQLNVRRANELLPGATTGFLVQSVLVMLLASLVVGIRCAGAISQERERGTWEAVLLTPISARAIVRGKLWGIVGASLWYLLAYAAPAVSLSAIGGPLALSYTLVWLAVTVLAMYFIGATGLWCSVRSKNSWRGLLQTMAVGYVGGLAIYVVTSPLLAALALIFIACLVLIDYFLETTLAPLCLANLGNFLRVFYLASAVGLVLTFWLLARMFLTRAQRWIADRERTRHWYDEPLPTRFKRTSRL